MVFIVESVLGQVISEYFRFPVSNILPVLKTNISFTYHRQYEPRYRRRYSDPLRDGRFRDRIPVGAKFFAPVQTDPRAQPTLYTTDTGPFPGVKWSRHGVEHPSSSRTEVKERVELYISTLPLGLRGLL